MHNLVALVQILVLVIVSHLSGMSVVQFMLVQVQFCIFMIWYAEVYKGNK